MGVAVPANHRIKLKESEKRNKYQDIARELKQYIKYIGGGDTNCNWCTWNNPQRIGKEVRRRVNKSFLSLRVFGLFVFIFIVISTTFRPICPPAFFRCLSNSGTFTELRTTSFIESNGVTCSDSVSYNRVQVLSISVLLLACNQDWTCNLQMIISLEA